MPRVSFHSDVLLVCTCFPGTHVVSGALAVKRVAPSGRRSQVVGVEWAEQPRGVPVT